jgi:UDP-glucose 4-epimerase
MTVLITGATGLIGRHTVAHFVGRGEPVRTFQRGPRVDSPGVEAIQGDVRTDVATLGAAARGCRAIVHLAGRGDVGESRRDPAGYALLNATGALHALEAARGAGAMFLLASSQRVYPLKPGLCREDEPLAPDSPYGYAKWVAELWCRMTSEQFGVSSRVLRFFSVYGPGQQANGGSGVVTIFLKAALANQPLLIQSAGQRDFSDVSDVAHGIGLALDLAPDGMHRVFNVATGIGTTFRQLADLIVELTGSRSTIQEQLAEPPGQDLVADISRARAELGYVPHLGLRDGLERYVHCLGQAV